MSILHNTYSLLGLNRIYVNVLEEVYPKTYTSYRADYTFLIFIPIYVPLVLQKGPVEGGDLPANFRDVQFFGWEGGSTSSLDCVYHYK